MPRTNAAKLAAVLAAPTAAAPVAPVLTVVPTAPAPDTLKSATNVKNGAAVPATDLSVDGWTLFDVQTGAPDADLLKTVTLRPSKNPWYPVIEAIAARKGACFIKLERTESTQTTPEETVKERQGTCYHENEVGELVPREDHCIVKSAKRAAPKNPSSAIKSARSQAIDRHVKNAHKVRVEAGKEAGVFYLVKDV